MILNKLAKDRARILRSGQPIPLTDVVDKAEMQGDGRKRELIYFIQHLSVEENGIRKFATEFLEANKGKFATPTMRKIGLKPGKTYSPLQSQKIRSEISPDPSRVDLYGPPPFEHIVMDGKNVTFDLDAWFPLKGEIDLPHPKEYTRELAKLDLSESSYFVLSKSEYEKCYERRRKVAEKFPCSYAYDDFATLCVPTLEKIEEALVSICLDPYAVLAFDAENDVINEYEARAKLWARSVEDEGDFYKINLPNLPGLLDCLVEFRNEWRHQSEPRFVETSMFKLMEDDVDRAVMNGDIVQIVARSGSGKTIAAKHICRRMGGTARLIQLHANLSQKRFYQLICSEIGIQIAPSTPISHLQWMISKCMKKARLVIVFDEAQALFSVSREGAGNPDLFDWIYTAFTNESIPVVMMGTPMFTKRWQDLETQYPNWDSRQYKRRVARGIEYPEKPPESDFKAVVDIWFPFLTKAKRKRVLGASANSQAGLKAVEHIFNDSLMIARKAGRKQPTAADVDRAIDIYRIPTELTLLPANLAKRPAKRSNSNQLQRGCSDVSQDDLDDRISFNDPVSDRDPTERNGDLSGSRSTRASATGA